MYPCTHTHTHTHTHTCMPHTHAHTHSQTNQCIILFINVISGRRTIWTLVDIMSKHKDYPEVWYAVCYSIFCLLLFSGPASTSLTVCVTPYYLSCSQLLPWVDTYMDTHTYMHTHTYTLIINAYVNDNFDCLYYFWHSQLVQNCCICLYPYQTMQDSVS